MKPRKSTVLIVLLTFILAAFALAMAQGSTQTDQNKKAESCCAEGEKCCAEGSCKHDGAEARSCCKEGAECCKEGAECCKKESADKDHAACCGESCELGGKHDAKHDGKTKHDPKKHGECCKVKTKDGKTKT
jgi:hypothetical protein